MKSSTFAPLIVLAGLSSFVGVSGAPVDTGMRRRAEGDPTETQILQFALTLEHLEDNFYSSALGKFDEASFESAGFPPWVRGRMAQIGQHESSHVKFLTGALGSDAVAACEYNFPYTDARSFLELSKVLEGVGTSAYLGAAKFLPDPSVLTAAGAILTTEARHDAWVGSAGLKGEPWSGSFDTPLSQNMVFTLAAGFITSCPEGNAPLPFTAFPSLTITPSDSAVPTPGGKVSLAFNETSSAAADEKRYLALFSGLNTLFAEIDGNNEATLPDGLQGTVYAVISNNGTAVTDDSTIAGPAILSFPFSSSASNP